MRTIKIIILLFFIVSIFFILGSIVFGKLLPKNNAFIPAVEESLDHPFEGELYFNDLDGYDVYLKKVLDVLNSAEHSIQIAMYSIRSPEIVEILYNKQQAGIEIIIVTPQSKTEQHGYVFEFVDVPLIEIGKTSTDDETLGDLMHHKFILIDSGYRTQTLLFGSSNLTFLQQKYDPSFLTMTHDAFMIDIFQKEFDLLKEEIHGVKKIFKKAYNPFAYKGVYTNGFIETWFSPGYLKNSIKYRMLGLIEDADTSIKIIGWRINDEDIYRALTQKVRQGVAVHVIVDDYYMWDSNSIGLLLNGFEKNSGTELLDSSTDSYVHVRMLKGLLGKGDDLSDTFNSFLHHHTLIVDDEVLVTGSNNWGGNGFYYNDESVIVTNIENLVTQYVDYFSYLHTSLHGEKKQVTIDKNNILQINPEPKEGSNILIYIEKSHPDWVGEVCLELSYKDYISGQTIPSSCQTSTTRVFVTDKNYNLQGSGYLGL